MRGEDLSNEYVDWTCAYGIIGFVPYMTHLKNKKCFKHTYSKIKKKIDKGGE